MRPIFLIIFSMLSYHGIAAKVTVTAMDYKYICTELVYFTAPAQTQFEVGDDVYVRLDCGDPQFIYSVKLYLGHQLIGIDATAPYEWGKPNSADDPALRNMAAGNYALTAKVRYTCGNYRTFKKSIKVGFNRPMAVYTGGLSLQWLNTVRQQHPSRKIAEYRRGGEILFKTQPCDGQPGQIIWYSAGGQTLGRFPVNSRDQGSFQNARFFKVVFDPCPS